jgi:hypothetical protein
VVHGIARQSLGHGGDLQFAIAFTEHAGFGNRLTML